MEYEDKKYILKKLMQDALTEEERIALQSSRRVTKKWSGNGITLRMQREAIARTNRLSGGIFAGQSGNRAKDGKLRFIRYIAWLPPSCLY